MDAPFGSWGTQTFIAGRTAEPMIAPWVIKGAMDGAAFAAYVEKALVPEPSPGTVVIPDNLATHRTGDAEKAIRAAGCRFLFRCSGKPPHWGLSRSLQPLQSRSQPGLRPFRAELILRINSKTPFTPIEMAFSKLEAHLRRIGARTFTDMFNAIAEICDLCSPDECWNYFKAAGYVAG